MHLTYRPASVGDVALCADLLPEGFVADPGAIRDMLDVWRTWLREERMALTMVENSALKGNRIVAFGSSVFVTDDYIQEAAAFCEPPIAVDIARRSTSRKPLVLDYQAVSKANGCGGLNLLIPVVGWSRSKLNPEAVPFVKAKLVEAFEARFGGYLLKAMLQEIYSEAEMRRGLAIGLLLKSDYAWHYQKTGALPVPERRPYLLGISREEVQEGSLISRSFLYTPPRFYFKRGERDLLTLANLDQTDEEAAQALCISLSTVQKRWRSIYDRVSSVEPDLLPGVNLPGPNGQRTGSEKKRLLLRYLKHHPEEFRPASPPDTSGTQA